MKQIISTTKAPAAIGPYSQAVEAGNMLFVSGQIPIDPETGLISGNTVAEQTQLVLSNLSNVLDAAGYTLAQVVKTTCFLKDMNTFGEMNAEYGKVFSENPPARAAVEVARLPKDVLIEIEAIAVR